MNLDFVVDTAAGSEGIFVSQEVLTSFYAFSPKIFNDIKIFPNPSDGLFFVELISTGNDVTIYDVQGRPILNKTINTNIARIDLTNYPKGIYVIEIKNKFGIENHKILVK